MLVFHKRPCRIYSGITIFKKQFPLTNVHVVYIQQIKPFLEELGTKQWLQGHSKLGHFFFLKLYWKRFVLKRSFPVPISQTGVWSFIVNTFLGLSDFNIFNKFLAQPCICSCTESHYVDCIIWFMYVKGVGEEMFFF